MRNAPPSQSVELLLRALFEGTASDGPWVAHNGVAWEMEELAYCEPLDIWIPYQHLLLTLASDRTRALTRQTALAVRAAVDQLLVLLDMYEQGCGKDGAGAHMGGYGAPPRQGARIRRVAYGRSMKERGKQ